MIIRRSNALRMLARNAVTSRGCSGGAARTAAISFSFTRHLHHDGRNRLSAFWTPTQRAPATQDAPGSGISSHDLLLRAGYLRQSHAGLFHFLPLGQRLHSKLERLIDKHMTSLSASKVSLSTLSSETLWQRTGRLDTTRTSELLRLKDRKGAKFLLAPTHEEEITTLVAAEVHSYKQLPLRLYQVTRKYRDEARPRGGLLRGREFVMKDLYTFDADPEAALRTYEEVREAYRALFADLGVDVLVAKADSGSIGGDLSHEWHFASDAGEDVVIQCDGCGYAVNEELYVGKYDERHSLEGQPEVLTTHCISTDRRTLCTIHYPASSGAPNVAAIATLFPDLDRSLSGPSAEAALLSSANHLTLTDPRLLPADQRTNETPLLTLPLPSTPCPSCQTGSLTLTPCIEIAHTFHLGTRYTIPLSAYALSPSNTREPLEMGCHGIGVSRLIAALAAKMADDKGLNWPIRVAPFGAVVVPGEAVGDGESGSLYDILRGINAGEEALDVVIDDRKLPMGWRLKDADAVGYPVVIVMGRGWADEKVELQCRRLGVKEEVEVAEVVNRVRELVARLS